MYHVFPSIKFYEYFLITGKRNKKADKVSDSIFKMMEMENESRNRKSGRGERERKFVCVLRQRKRIGNEMKGDGRRMGKEDK